MKSHYEKLIGYKVIGVVEDNAEGYEEGDEEWYGMVLRKGNSMATVWISADEEFNYPGFLSIDFMPTEEGSNNE